MNTFFKYVIAGLTRSATHRERLVRQAHHDTFVTLSLSKGLDSRPMGRDPRVIDLRGNDTIGCLIIILLVTCYLSLVAMAHAEVLERIVAIVNNHAILLSELEENYQSALKSDAAVSRKKVLHDMIDRILLLEQARRLRLGDSDEVTDDESLLKNYIERRIKSFIYIPLDEIEAYYKQNREQFGKEEFYDVKDEIEDILAERVLDKKLAEHVDELRKKASIRIQLE